jgi:hypothetical protein
MDEGTLLNTVSTFTVSVENVNSLAADAPKLSSSAQDIIINATIDGKKNKGLYIIDI